MKPRRLPGSLPPAHLAGLVACGLRRPLRPHHEAPLTKIAADGIGRGVLSDAD